MEDMEEPRHSYARPCAVQTGTMQQRISTTAKAKRINKSMQKCPQRMLLFCKLVHSRHIHLPKSLSYSEALTAEQVAMNSHCTPSLRLPQAYPMNSQRKKFDSQRPRRHFSFEAFFTLQTAGHNGKNRVKLCATSNLMVRIGCEFSLNWEHGICLKCPFAVNFPRWRNRGKICLPISQISCWRRLLPNCGVSHSKGVRYQLDPTSFARLLPPFWFRYNVMWVKMHSSHPN